MQEGKDMFQRIKREINPRHKNYGGIFDAIYLKANVRHNVKAMIINDVCVRVNNGEY